LYVSTGVVYELANHIADVADGNSRHRLAAELSETVIQCIEEQQPWSIVPAAELQGLRSHCCVFADQFARQQIGLTDTTTIHEARRLKSKYNQPGQYVHIWTMHHRLKAHEPDREPDGFLG